MGVKGPKKKKDVGLRMTMPQAAGKNERTYIGDDMRFGQLTRDMPLGQFLCNGFLPCVTYKLSRSSTNFGVDKSLTFMVKLGPMPLYVAPIEIPSSLSFGLVSRIDTYVTSSLHQPWSSSRPLAGHMLTNGP